LNQAEAFRPARFFVSFRTRHRKTELAGKERKASWIQWAAKSGSRNPTVCETTRV
jgi:hypothetical protein